MNQFNSLSARTLRQLYLTLFLRGRSSRGLRRETVPRSVGRKLVGVMLLYVLVGITALAVVNHDVFMTALFLHTMGMLFTGMFVAASAGEMLFNKDESEILGHRPVDPRQLLWAKVYVLVKVSVLIAVSYSVAGCIIVMCRGHRDLFFPVAHVVSVALSSIFGTSFVVLLYQLCMRFFGREKLDNLMTFAQMLLALGTVLGSQLIRPMMMGVSAIGDLSDAWWIFLVPSSWFAGIDLVLTGHADVGSVVMALLGLIATATTAGFAFGKLATGMHEGAISLLETPAPREKSYARRSWLGRLTEVPPLSLLLRNPVTRASFRLCVAYMVRDRDTKLRLYPGVTPILAMPFVFLVAGMGSKGFAGGGGGFALGLSGGYVGLIPLLAMNLLQFSQNWQAADVFRLGPAATPAHFIRGALVAIFVVLVIPSAILLTGVSLLLSKSNQQDLLLLLPGAIALPAYAFLAGATARAAPLSRPVEESKSAGRGMKMTLIMITAMVLGTAGYMASAAGHFALFLIVEAAVSLVVCIAANASISRVPWDPAE